MQIDQRSPEWFAVRCGRVTASRVADVIAKTKSGYSTSRANYAAQLVCERLTGAVEPSYTNAAMQWGTDKEPEARAAYAFENVVAVEEVGFIVHPRIMASGASPDGLVGSDGMLEIKCPISATHIDTLLNDTIADKYIVQMQWQMACADRQWCDFVSYDPRLPLDMQTYTKRVARDDARIAELEAEVRAFLADIGKTVDQLKARYGAEIPWAPSVLEAA
jgi:putative phage-type endonuclease